MYIKKEQALFKWQRKIRNLKILRICAWLTPFLVFLSAVGWMWLRFGNLRFGFGAFMAKIFGGHSVQDDAANSFEKVFTVGFIVLITALFIVLLLGVLKVKSIIRERKNCDFAGRFKNIGLTNKSGGTPIFLNKRLDPNTVGGEIYSFADADIDFGKFNEAVVIRGLRNIFRGTVRPDFSTTYGLIKFYVQPSDKAPLRPLTIEDKQIVQYMYSAGIFGAPGAGKTTGIGFLLYLNCLYADENNKELELFLFDQKMTFAAALGVADSKSFFYGSNVLDGLIQANETLEKIKLNPDGKTRLYIIDEAITFMERLEQLDRKKAVQAKSLLATLIYEGREYQIFTYLAGQSSRAERFSPGLRDSLNTKFYFGNMSETEKRMLFPADVALMDAHNGVGEGYYRIENSMPHVERFSISGAMGAMTDFTEIGKMVRRHMKF